MKIFSVVTMVVILTSCAHNNLNSETNQNREPSQVPAAKAKLPDANRWVEIENYAKNIDLTDASTELKPSTGGTSVYAIIKQNNQYVGAVIPENSASILSGEIVAFNLARALGTADIFQPAFYHFLNGKNLKPFTRLIENTEAKSKNKLENKKVVLERLAKHPEGIPTAFKKFGTKPVDYDNAVSVNANTLRTSHILNGSQRTIGEMLNCKGTQPSQSVTVKMNGGQTTEAEAIKQLSNIFMIDALTQQWDRFSGGNLQTVTENGKVMFVSFDNGGTWGGGSKTRLFMSLVSRFDRTLAERVLQLDDFFEKQIPFQGITNDRQMMEALDIEAYPKSYQRLKDSVTLLADHIRMNPNCFFQ